MTRSLTAVMAISMAAMMYIRFLAYRILVDSLPDSVMDDGSPKDMHQLPPVLLIGVQKAGTTAIGHWLFDAGFRKSHVFDGEPFFYDKEPHFFDYPEEFKKGIKFYASRFQTDAGESGAPALDATPDTFRYPERVRETYLKAGGNQVNDVKMIVILRDPVTRELSLYNHIVNDYLENPDNPTPVFRSISKKDGSVMSFEEYVDTVSIPTLTGKDSCPNSRNSLYALHLEKWFKLFSRRQILVLSYEELKRDKNVFCKRIMEFLGHDISEEIVVNTLNTQESEIKLLEPSPETREKLLRVLKPQYTELYQLLDKWPGPPMEQRPFPRFPEN